MKVGMGLPDLVLCPECEEAVKQENGRFCETCGKKVHDYQKKHNLVIDFWLRGETGAQGESGFAGTEVFYRKMAEEP